MTKDRFAKFRALARITREVSNEDADEKNHKKAAKQFLGRFPTPQSLLDAITHLNLEEKGVS